MPDSALLAVQLARCVELFRDPAAKEAQKAEFRTLMTLLRDQDLRLREDGPRVLVNGVPLDGPAVAPLLHRLALHNVGEMSVPKAPPASEVFQLLTALA